MISAGPLSKNASLLTAVTTTKIHQANAALFLCQLYLFSSRHHMRDSLIGSKNWLTILWEFLAQTAQVRDPWWSNSFRCTHQAFQILEDKSSRHFLVRISLQFCTPPLTYTEWYSCDITRLWKRDGALLGRRIARSSFDWTNDGCRRQSFRPLGGPAAREHAAAERAAAAPWPVPAVKTRHIWWY